MFSRLALVSRRVVVSQREREREGRGSKFSISIHDVPFAMFPSLCSLRYVPFAMFPSLCSLRYVPFAMSMEWPHLDLNQGPTGYEPAALTN
jgi:hypothetical protein